MRSAPTATSAALLCFDCLPSLPSCLCKPLVAVIARKIDFATMQSKRRPGVFFCGEVLDIDGITGGYNFQSAWTTGFIAGRSCGESLLPLLRAAEFNKRESDETA